MTAGTVCAAGVTYHWRLHGKDVAIIVKGDTVLVSCQEGVAVVCGDVSGDVRSVAIDGGYEIRHKKNGRWRKAATVLVDNC